jgi:glycosyltransferase involved in cell wall biosynthesis
VSVIIPTYNWSSVLRYSIASVLRQTYANLELLVVGDCCTDDSEKVVASFRDARVCWQNLAENSGSQSAPNNAGLRHARGEIVAYLGHDDLWLPGHLGALVAALERTGAAAAWTICAAVGPPGSNVLRLAGVGELARAWIPPTVLAHRADAVEEVGPWRDYRTIVEAPDAEFIARVRGASGGSVAVPALTSVKFGAAWRPDSYRLRRSDEQAAYTQRIRHPHRFVIQELAAHAWLEIRRRPERLPQVDAEPEVVPPGWHVTQWRRIRGLPDDPAG